MNKEWEEKYWELWQVEDLTHTSQDILNFIRNLLSAQKKEIVEMVLKYSAHIPKAVLSEIITKLNQI